uniref:SJCHGC07828 protein n=1 Tax=Schistosoma japonicum TaxID=6182 RepID=Q5BRM2_SCHJA|nr:SJCHGC07828 protein [Schistosoma japonicum]
MFRVQNATLTPWSKSEQSQKCSHCLNTYFTMSSSRHISYVAREIFPACLLAGVGMVVAGCYVDMLQSSV